MLTHKQLMYWLLCSGVALAACKQPSDAQREVVPAPAEAPSSPLTAEPEVAAVERESAIPIHEAEAEALVAEARTVASAMDAAVAALDINQLDEANAELDKAIVAFEQIHAQRPTINIAVELWRKHRQLRLEELVSGVDTIPLLVTVTRADVPVHDREQIQARQQHRAGQAPGSVSKQEKLTDLQIIDSNLVYFEVDLPIASTEIAVIEARRLLQQGQPEQAKAALLRGIGSVEVVEHVAEAPGARARQLIWDAQREFVKGDNARAKRLLTEAHDMLAPLAASEDDPGAQRMVKMLLSEIEPLQDTLSEGSAEQTNTFRWLTHSIASFARHAAIRSKLSRHRHLEESALADAAMWLEAARIAPLLATDRRNVERGDLQLANAALAGAIEIAPASVKPSLDDLRARISELAELERSSPQDRAQHEAELRSVIFDLRMLMLERGLTPATYKHPFGQG